MQNYVNFAQNILISFISIMKSTYQLILLNMRLKLLASQQLLYKASYIQIIAVIWSNTLNTVFPKSRDSFYIGSYYNKMGHYI